LNRLSDVKKIIKLNIQTAYNFIRIKKRNKWKTTFRCRYKHFEYRVMFFDLANAFATFQIHINFALRKYLDDFCVCYLNDILIYFQKEENHTNHVRLVLKRLKRHKMFVKFSKCVFDLEEIDYLEFIVKVNDIRMNFAKVATIKEWVESTTRRHVRAFIEIARFYKTFIEKFSKITEPSIALYRKRRTSRVALWHFKIDVLNIRLRRLRNALRKRNVWILKDAKMIIAKFLIQTFEKEHFIFWIEANIVNNSEKFESNVIDHLRKIDFNRNFINYSWQTQSRSKSRKSKLSIRKRLIQSIQLLNKEKLLIRQRFSFSQLTKQQSF
jgi:hypothetical protein